jgi:peptidoglycan/LPS O-acetylase OafA/YrhL
MFAATTDHPLTGAVLWAVGIAGAVLLIGAIVARRWRGLSAVWVRSLAALVAIGVPIAFDLLAPATTLEELGRMLTIWPLAALGLVFFGIWAWRGRTRRDEL